MLATANDNRTKTGRRFAARLGCVLFAVLIGPQPLVAQDLAVPESCNAVATVHYSACETTTYLQCGDAGWLGVTHMRGKQLGVTHYGTDWNFLKWETEGSARMTFEIVPNSGKALDWDVLREDQVQEASADYVINTKVLKNQGFVLSGSTRATGEVVTLNGEAFDVYEGERNFKRNGASMTLNFRMRLLFSQERDLMIDGSSQRAVNGHGWMPVATQPQALRGPGEPGFLATTSEFGC